MKYTLATLLVVSLAFFVGCKSNDTSTTATKPAIFLHNVTDAGQLYLDGSTRPYGRIDYGTFGNGAMLAVGSWNLQIKDENDQDSAGNKTLLEQDFTVADQTQAAIYALSGSQAEGTIKLHALKTAVDPETSSTATTDGVIYINVANIHPKYTEIDVFVLSGAETVESSVPDATLAYGEYSADLKLESATQRFVVIEKNTGDTLFDSGEKTLEDKLQQSVIFAQGTASEESFRAYYFYGSTFDSTVWGDGLGKTQVRIFNATDEDLVSVKAQRGADEEKTMATALKPQTTSSYLVDLPVGQYRFPIKFANDATEFTATSYLAAGKKETIIVTGSNSDSNPLKAIKFSNDQRVVTSRALVTLVHAAYEPDKDNYEEYDVHLTTGNTEDLDTRQPEINKFGFREVGKIEKLVGAGNTTGVYYSLSVKIKNREVAYKNDLLLKAGDHHQIVLIKTEGGVELVSLPNL